MFRIFLLAALFIFSMPAVAVVDPCENAKNTADEIACAQNRYEVAQDDLNDSYDVAFEALVDEAQGAFREDQQRWVRFRDAKCAWESHENDDEEAVQRLHELQCRLRETQDRIVDFQIELQSEGDAVEADEALHALHVRHARPDVLNIPRWLNTVSEAERDVFWNFAQRQTGDFNCDAVQDYFLEGIAPRAGNLHHFVALVEDTPNGLPQHWVFDLPISQVDADVEGEDRRVCAGDWAVVSQDDQGQDLCNRYFSVRDSICGEYEIRWDGEAYSFSAIVDKAMADEVSEIE